MRETFSVEQSTNLEKNNLGIIAVSSESIQDLENIRREVDGEKNTEPSEKFLGELKRYEGGGDHTAFLIRDGEKVVGYIEVDLSEDYIPKGADKELCKELEGLAHIARIGLLPEYRGRKIGNKLLNHAEAWAKGHGMTAVWLDYLPGKEQLVQFYESAGYTAFTEFKDADKDRLRRIAVKRF
jgi:ribosomal protein S18 acetylase RimI-like enzyme